MGSESGSSEDGDESEVRDSISHMPSLPRLRTGRRTATFMVDQESKQSLRKTLKLKQRSQVALEHARAVAAGGAVFSMSPAPPGMDCRGPFSRACSEKFARKKNPGNGAEKFERNRANSHTSHCDAEVDSGSRKLGTGDPD